MKHLKMMKVDDYIKEYCDDCIDIGVKFVYGGVYNDGEDVEETAIAGWVFEDGTCQIVGCRTDYKCSFDEMIERLYAELDRIEQYYV